MRHCENHLSPEDIALIIQGKVDPQDRLVIMEHVRGCSECLDALRDTAIYHEVPAPDLEDSEGARAVASAAQDLMQGSVSKVSSIKSLEGRSPYRRLVRYSAIATAAGMILVIGMMMGSFWQQRSTTMNGDIKSPVQGAIETLSSRGPIVFPGGEEGMQIGDPVYRSGYIPLSGSLKESVNVLYEQYSDNTQSSEITYWLLSAYATTGQIDIARNIAADARMRFPEDTRIAILEAIIAYLDQDYEGAESMLREVLESNPGDPVASLDLAIVLIEQNEKTEARSLLTQILQDVPGTPLAQRAESILADL